MDRARLTEIPLFAGLTLDQVDVLAGACDEIEVEEGATLLREGDFGYAMFAITAGTATVIRDGKVVARLGPGDVFGEIAVLAGGRRVATVVASTPMRLVTVLNRELWRLEREVPDVAAVLRSTVAERLGPATA
jgi:CRP-like cAMP-binding protein